MSFTLTSELTTILNLMRPCNSLAQPPRDGGRTQSPGHRSVTSEGMLSSPIPFIMYLYSPNNGLWRAGEEGAYLTRLWGSAVAYRLALNVNPWRVQILLLMKILELVMARSFTSRSDGLQGFGYYWDV
ncbi:hypothetical protein RRG08_014425 [Elysia crispata]|uniref:Uncharacterized protein n=1 Tax=Elysia crispata TaxID=231223 RepID=A0AAE0YVB1_9GAST|nr:hypothetical protein RRG08_014425 [Elysia crispata]